MEATTDLLAALKFMKRMPRYATEKPYTIDYRVGKWEGDIGRTNFQSEWVDHVPIGDIRGKEDRFNFDTAGFGIVEMESSMSYPDFDDSYKVDSVYCQEVASCILRYFDAASVQIYDVEVRRRHPSFPNVQVLPGMATQPAQRVHIDGTRQACFDILDEVDGPARQYKRHLFINVWRPLKGPLHDWPLAFCDATTVDVKDLDTHDHVFTNDLVRENVMIYHNPEQKWYYLSGQTPSELLLFRQADTQGRVGVPHTAFDIPQSKSGQREMLRESIEVRAIVCFDE